MARSSPRRAALEARCFTSSGDIPACCVSEAANISCAFALFNKSAFKFVAASLSNKARSASNLACWYNSVGDRRNILLSIFLRIGPFTSNPTTIVPALLGRSVKLGSVESL